MYIYHIDESNDRVVGTKRKIVVRHAMHAMMKGRDRDREIERDRD